MLNIVNETLASDTYAIDDNVVDRLVNEYDQYGNLIIAYDFDNTVFDEFNEGESHDQVIELIRACKSMGFILVVYTCRPESQYQMVKEFLITNNIPFDYINEDAPMTDFPHSYRKIFYNVFLDDRAGLRSAYETLVKTIDVLQKRGVK